MTNNSGPASGFTLIETLIVMVLLGILVSVAVPAWESGVLRSRRLHARLMLIDAAHQLEVCHLGTRSFLNCELTWGNGVKSRQGYYRYGIDVLNARYYRLTAVPGRSQKRDRQCGIISLDSEQHWRVSGTARVADCW